MSVQEPYTRQVKARNPAKTERFEARMTPEQKARLERAAELAGRSITDFVLGSADAEARRLLLAEQTLELNDRDSAIFAAAILEAPEPGEHLREAAARYIESNAARR